MSIGSRKWWLCVAPASVCAVDATVTLLFQPPTYWAGQFGTVNEGSPIDHWMLVQHPLVFVTWVATWIAAFSTALQYLPTRASLIVSLLLILGNASGASSWLIWRLPSGFWIGYGMFGLFAALIIVTWAKAGVLPTPPPRLPPA
jgi:hypothetical protein